MLKRLLPHGLYGRAALILVLPVVAVTSVVSVVFLQRHFDGVTRQMTAGMMHEMALVRGIAEAAPDLAAAQREARGPAAALGLAIALPVPPPERAETRGWIDLSGAAMADELRARLPGVLAVDLGQNRRVTVTLASAWGPMALSFDRSRVSASNPHQLLVLMLAAALLASGIASVFLRGQLRPIRRLARAAEAFGRGVSLPYKPAGATEIRSAGAAFLDMRARIERQIETRTLLLSGVSHDLRTPLTRLRLGLSMLPQDAETEALARDAAEMARLLDGFLDFVRGDAASAPAEPARVRPFLAGIAADAARSGRPVRLLDGPDLTASFRPDAMRRAIENLLGNAARHGRAVELSLSTSERSWIVAVEDDGPGIPEVRREDAVRPFVRLDPARNQDGGGGVGLGLAITADIARAHGGSLRLGQGGRLGGLLAEIVLPR